MATAATFKARFLKANLTDSLLLLKTQCGLRSAEYDISRESLRLEGSPEGILSACRLVAERDIFILSDISSSWNGDRRIREAIRAAKQERFSEKLSSLGVPGCFGAMSGRMITTKTTCEQENKVFGELGGCLKCSVFDKCLGLSTLTELKKLGPRLEA